MGALVKTQNLVRTKGELVKETGQKLLYASSKPVTVDYLPDLATRDGRTVSSAAKTGRR